jgi:flagellar motor switch protein FliN/FliY
MSQPGSAAPAQEPVEAADEGFAPTAGEPAAESAQSLLNRPPYRAFHSLPVEIAVCVGTARPPLGELLAMGPDAVIVLDRRIEDPVDIRVGDRVIARGELQELEDGSGRLGVRLTEIADRGGGF